MLFLNGSADGWQRIWHRHRLMIQSQHPPGGILLTLSQTALDRREQAAGFGDWQAARAIMSANGWSVKSNSSDGDGERRLFEQCVKIYFSSNSIDGRALPKNIPSIINVGRLRSAARRRCCWWIIEGLAAAAAAAAAAADAAAEVFNCCHWCWSFVCRWHCSHIRGVSARAAPCTDAPCSRITLMPRSSACATPSCPHLGELSVDPDHQIRDVISREKSTRKSNLKSALI